MRVSHMGHENAASRERSLEKNFISAWVSRTSCHRDVFLYLYPKTNTHQSYILININRPSSSFPKPHLHPSSPSSRVLSTPQTHHTALPIPQNQSKPSPFRQVGHSTTYLQ